MVEKDLTGIAFGNLIVIGRGIDYISPKGARNYQWVCRCLCKRSEDFLVRTSNLKNGRSNCCKKCSIEKRAKSNFKDLIGKKFGALTVIQRCPSHIQPNGYSATIFMVRCECGRTDDFPVWSSSLTSGQSISCKLCSYERIGNRSFVDISGRTFGILHVLELDHIEKDKGSYWKCQCECGNLVIKQSSLLKNGSTTSCGCLQESYMAASLKNYFKEFYNGISEYRIFKSNESGMYLPYDIYIPHGNNPEINGIYIEVHGIQHYELNGFHSRQATANGTTPREEFKKQNKRDKFKKKFAMKNGIYIEIDLRLEKTLEENINYILSIMENQ